MEGIFLPLAFFFHRLVEEKPLLTIPCLPIQYPAPSFITRVSSLHVFFHLGRFLLSFSQLFSFVPAPSYHLALTWSPRLRNKLSSVATLVYYFISNTFTLRREKLKCFCLFNIFHIYTNPGFFSERVKCGTLMLPILTYIYS